jgi:hypothetical protein
MNASNDALPLSNILSGIFIVLPSPLTLGRFPRTGLLTANPSEVLRIFTRTGSTAVATRIRSAGNTGCVKAESRSEKNAVK